ncbi:unnamed protein product, partial [Polarella glacialis]
APDVLEHSAAAAALASASEEATQEEPAQEKAQTSEDKPSSNKRIQRVTQTWQGDDASQVSVSELDFVEVRLDTQTEHGWIHGQKLVPNTGEAGWIPLCILQNLEEDQAWMRVKQTWQASDASQLCADEGSMALVWTSTRTAEGWTYVDKQEKDGGMTPGWLPDFCFDWVN